MSKDDSPPSLGVKRVRLLAQAFIATDLVRLRIEREGDAVELCRSLPQAKDGAESSFAAPAPSALANGSSKTLETIKADLVGIFKLSRPAPQEGERFDGDRELAYVEALGIRNPVRSLGAGRISAIRCKDGDAVEYGQPLFEIERG